MDSKDKTLGLQHLPQQYSLVRGEEDRGTLKYQRRLRKVEQNSSPLESQVLMQVPYLDHNCDPLNLEKDPPPLLNVLAMARRNERHEILG